MSIIFPSNRNFLLVENKMFRELFEKLVQNKLDRDQSLVRLVLSLISFVQNQPEELSVVDVLFIQRFFYSFNQKFSSLDGVFCKGPKRFIRVMAKLYENRVKRAKKIIFYATLKVIYNPEHPVGRICVGREIQNIMNMYAELPKV